MTAGHTSASPASQKRPRGSIALDRERQSSVGKNEKMEMLYRYLAGTEFKQKIEGIVEAFTAMQDQVNRERRAMEKNWKEREKQIARVIKNTVGLYGGKASSEARSRKSRRWKLEREW